MKKVKKPIVMLLAVILLSTGMGVFSKLPVHGQSTELNKMELKKLKKALSIKPNDILNMTVKDLIKYSKDNNIDIQLLLNIATGDLNTDLNIKKIISREEAKKIALKFINGEIQEIKLDNLKGDERAEYKIKILKDDILFKVEIDAYTGKVKDIEVEYYQVDNQNQVKEVISEEQIKKIALNFVNGKILKIELDFDDDDTAEYEVKVMKDGIKYELEIDAFTGKLLKKEIDD